MDAEHARNEMHLKSKYIVYIQTFVSIQDVFHAVP